MSEPEETTSESETGPGSRPPAKIIPFTRSRPDWLTGPGDDVRSADAAEAPDPGRHPEPILFRPGAGPRTANAPPRQEPDATSTEPEEPASDSGLDDAPADDTTPRAWAPAASSIPTLRMPLPEEPVGAEEPAASPAERPRGLPGGDEDRRTAPPPVALVPLREPWWLIAVDALRSDWRVQSAAAAALLVLVALGFALWPHGPDSTSIRSMRRDPTGFDGRTVLVRGRVGDDVYSVGSGWAFYLTQGSDTIVAFTRAHAPSPHQVVSVKGTVSTGFLDGQPRQALFEDPQPAK